MKNPDVSPTKAVFLTAEKKPARAKQKLFKPSIYKNSLFTLNADQEGQSSKTIETGGSDGGVDGEDVVSLEVYRNH